MRVIDIEIQKNIMFTLRDFSVNDTYDCVFINESNNYSFENVIIQSKETFYCNNNNFIYPLTGEFKEGDEYTLKISDNENKRTLYRCKIFFTSDVPQNYSINE